MINTAPVNDNYDNNVKQEGVRVQITEWTNERGILSSF